MKLAKNQCASFNFVMRYAMRRFSIMCFIQFRLFLPIAILLLHTGVSIGQQVIINSSGEKVVIFPDGSWRLYQASDSVLLKNSIGKEEVLNPESDNEVYDDVSNNPGEITGSTQMARQFADLTLRQSREANRKLAAVIDQKFAVEAQLKQAEENKNLVEPDLLADLKEQYDASIDAVKDARKHQKEATRFAEDAQEVLNMPMEKRPKSLEKLMVKHSAYYADRNETLTLDETVIAAAPDSRTEIIQSSPESSVNNAPGRMSDPISSYQRKPTECTAVVKELDSKGKPEYIVIERDMILTHTDEDLRPYFRDKAFLTCWGQISQVGKETYLSVEFNIASPNAQKDFGSLGEGSLLRLTLIDGTELDLVNLQGDAGQIDPYSGNTIFIGRYLVESTQQRKAAKLELDKMRVVWSTGYEDYEVLDVDFLIDQLACLEIQQ
jgi:hypothetical protein